MCSGAINVTAPAGQSSAAVVFPAPTPHPPAESVVCSPASGSAFPVRATQVTCPAYGFNGPFADGLRATCEFPVVVNEAQP
jgi:hypothetical protein